MMRRFLRVASCFSLLFLAACAPAPQPPAGQEPVPATDEAVVPAEEEKSGAMDANAEDAQQTSSKEQNEMMEETVDEEGASGAMAPRSITITSDNWSFSPAVIMVKKGERVNLSVKGVGGVHGYAVPGLGINETVMPDQTVLIEIPTDKAGSFDVLCSIPCGAGHKDMTGKIIIEE